jgi:hypothetical protein
MAINNFNVGVGTTSQLTRYRYVATGGETSVSGSDADGKTLSYTVGLEQVFLNGVNLVRGQDYTATNGTSVGSLTALVASDVVEVFAFVPFNIANALTVSTVDAKGDLLVGTGADAVGRLAVGSTDGQLLSVASGETSGLKWANGGMTLISTASFSGATSHSFGSDASPIFTSTYRNYKIILDNLNSATSDQNISFRLRANTTDLTTTVYEWEQLTATSTTVAGARNSTQSSFRIGTIGSDATNKSGIVVEVLNPQTSTQCNILANNMYIETTVGARVGNFFGSIVKSTAYNGFTIFASTNISGTVSIYGYNI